MPRRNKKKVRSHPSARPSSHKKPQPHRERDLEAKFDAPPRERGPESRATEFRDRSGRVHKIERKAKGPSTEGRPTGRRTSVAPRIEEWETHTQFKKQPQRGASGFRKLKATIDKNQKGFGFLIFEDREVEDAFVPPREAERFFHGDRVAVTLNPRGEVTHIEVLEHRFRELVGRWTPHPASNRHPDSSRGGWVVYERKRAREEVYSPKGASGAKANDWVKARLHFHRAGPFPVTAEITEVYGPELPASADIGMVSSEYSLDESHLDTAEREAKQMRLHIPGRDLQGREDLRKVPFITIDGETARDFDDAVYIERAANGYVLWVAIADVSHYVTEGSGLDTSARSKGTSVYFPERAFHMLPRALSENLCSLRPKEPRLAMVAKMQYDRDGKRSKTELMEAVIESHRRATYNEIEAEWQENKKNRNWEFMPHFELYQIIRRTRSQRGSIDFDLPEAEIRVDEQGEVISIKNRSRLDAHRLIEEFMIAANEAVTEWMLERNWPFVYRVHDEPAEEALLRFQTLAAHVGVKVSLGGRGEGRGSALATPKLRAEVVRRLEGHPAQTMLNMALLRSMKQAVYSSVHGIHYGLASQGYTHFTSPIRRYPDLIVHRLLRMAMKEEAGRARPMRRQDRDSLEQDLEAICEHCSYRERLASDAEREANKLKQVRLMTRHLGDEFDAKVVGMVESGLFAQLDDPFVEGMIPKDSMMDDFYEFNEDRMVFYGKRKKRTFQIGDKIKVRVIRADIDRRQIDFGLVDKNETVGAGPWTPPKPREPGHDHRRGEPKQRERHPQGHQPQGQFGGGKRRKKHR